MGVVGWSKRVRVGYRNYSGHGNLGGDKVEYKPL